MFTQTKYETHNPKGIPFRCTYATGGSPFYSYQIDILNPNEFHFSDAHRRQVDIFFGGGRRSSKTSYLMAVHGFLGEHMESFECAWGGGCGLPPFVCQQDLHEHVVDAHAKEAADRRCQWGGACGYVLDAFPFIFSYPCASVRV